VTRIHECLTAYFAGFYENFKLENVYNNLSNNKVQCELLI